MNYAIFVLTIYSFILKDVCVNGISLTPTNVDVWERSEITLACDDNANTLGVTRWNKTVQTAGSTFFAIDQTCVRPPQLSAELFSLKCTSTQHLFTIKNITAQNHQDMWQCQNVGLSGWSNIVTILIKVPVMDTAVNPKDVFTTKENTFGYFVCKTSACRPEPKFLWYKKASTQSIEGETIITEVVPRNVSDVKLQSYNHTYNLTFDRTWNGWKLFCGATNREDTVIMSSHILINITYPPDGPPQIELYHNGSTIPILKNTSLELICSITGGNPRPRLEWNKAGSFTQILHDTVTNTISWQATDNNLHDLVCQSFHQHKNDTTYVTFEVLYPPEAIDVSLIIDTTYNTSSIKHNFSVIENTSITMLLICSARSNPSPNSYMWTGPIQSNSARLEINIARHIRGTYICHVNNTMIAHDGRTEQGYNSAPYMIEILQSPDIGRLEDANVVEGNNVSIVCPIINGNDTWRSVTWLNKHSVQVGQNENLLLKNVTRNANGTYTCQLNFTMQPTYGTQRIKTIKKSLYLDVFYQAEILSLSINNEVNSLTLNESARVHFVCKVDSNPNSTVEITFNNKILSTKSNTQTLEYLVPSVNCNDTGTYICTGKNEYNTGQRATLDNKLFVLCSPRQSPSFELKQNVTSALNESATFQFTALAYPPPSVKWYLVVNGSETSENHTGVITSHIISTTEMQTDFTLDNVEVFEYGEYLLKVENQYGTYSQTFFLVAEGKPTPPTYYGLFPDSVTSNSVTIWWEPGYDGGLPQSFIISYNLTALKWYNESAISHNKERRLNNTITELASSSVYHVLIYAQNEKGAVRVPHAIIVNTKVESTETQAQPRSVGSAVGSTVGGLFAVITVTVTLIIVRQRKIGKRRRAQHKASDLKDLHTYQNFQNDGYSLSEVSSSAVYEKLQHPDSKSDQQYQQLTTILEKDTTDGPRVYENLKLSQQNMVKSVGGSSGSSQNTPAHNRSHV